MKITTPQRAALEYFKTMQGRFPTKRVRDALVEKGLLHYVVSTRFDYVLQCDVPHSVLRLSQAGEACV